MSIPEHWEQEIIEEIPCFFYEDGDGALQVAATRSQTGTYEVKAEMAKYFQRNEIDFDQIQVYEYETKAGVKVLASEYWLAERFWLTQFLVHADKMLLVLYNADEAPEPALAQEISAVIASIEFI